MRNFAEIADGHEPGWAGHRMVVRTLYDIDLELVDHPGPIHVAAGTLFEVEKEGLGISGRVFWVRIPGYGGVRIRK